MISQAQLQGYRLLGTATKTLLLLVMVGAASESSAASVAAGSSQSATSRPIVAPRLEFQIGHQVPIDKMAFSPDGRWLATGDGLGEFKLWDTRTGELLWTVPPVSYQLQALVFSPDSRLLAVGRGPSGIELWDTQTGKLKKALLASSRTKPSDVWPLAFSRDGQLLWFLNRDGVLQSVEIGTSRITRRWKVPGVLLAMTQHAGLSLTVDQFGKHQLWNVATGKLQLDLMVDKPEFGLAATTAAAFSSDGRFLATGRYDGRVRVWSMGTGKQVPLAQLSLHVMVRDPFGQEPVDKSTFVPNTVTSLSFSPDGKRLAVGVGDHPEIVGKASSIVIQMEIDSKTGKPIGEPVSLVPRGNTVKAVAFSPDGQTIATSDDEATVRLWNSRSRSIKQTLARGIADLTAMAIAPGGHYLATGSQHGPARVWNLTTGQLQSVLLPSEQQGAYLTQAPTITFSSDGQEVATGDWGGSIHLWNPTTGQLQSTLQATTGFIQSLAFSVNGQALVAGCEDGGTRVWEREEKTGSTNASARRWTLRRTLKSGSGLDVVAAALSSDGQKVASVGKFDPMNVWEIATKKRLHTLPIEGVDQVGGAFSEKGHLFAYPNARHIELWDVFGGKQKRKIPVGSDWVSSLMISPDEQWVAASVYKAGSTSSPLQIWDVATGSLRHMIRDWPVDAYAGAFFADNKRVACCTRTNTVQIRDVSTGKLLVSFMALPASQDLQVSRDWVAFTPEGYYDASPGAAPFLRWRVGQQLYPVEKYRAEFHSPDLVQKALQEK